MKNGEFKIEKGKPLPLRKGKGKYPFAKMKPGDSFKATIESNVIRSAAYYAGKRLKMKFTVAQEGLAYRVWRVE